MPDKIEKLKSLDNDKLIDVVKNYRQYGYDEIIRNTAITILHERGISKEDLKLSGNFDNHTYNRAGSLYELFNQNSKKAFIAYGIIFMNNLIFPIIIDNYSETIGIVYTLLTWTTINLYFFFLIKSFLNQDKFYKVINQNNGSEGVIMYLFLGLPFYIVMYFYFKKQMTEKMKEIK